MSIEVFALPSGQQKDLDQVGILCWSQGPFALKKSKNQGEVFMHLFVRDWVHNNYTIGGQEQSTAAENTTTPKSHSRKSLPA